MVPAAAVGQGVARRVALLTCSEAACALQRDCLPAYDRHHFRPPVPAGRGTQVIPGRYRSAYVGGELLLQHGPREAIVEPAKKHMELIMTVQTQVIAQERPRHRGRLTAVSLDPNSIRLANPEIERECRIAIFDLVEDGSVAIKGCAGGASRLHLAVVGEHLAISARGSGDHWARTVKVPLAPLLRTARDYRLMCETYFPAILTATAQRLQRLDAARRQTHEEGSQMLRELLEPDLIIEAPTARRLFTLICAIAQSLAPAPCLAGARH